MSDDTTKKTRIQELDIMKGLGMILIAVFHIVYRSMHGIADNLICSLGWAFIPVFFLMSGYTCRPDTSVRVSYRKRVMGLLLPVILTEFVLILLGGIYCILFHDYSVKDVLHDALVTFLRPEITTKISDQWGGGNLLFFNLSPVWFIWSLIWAELVFHPIRKLIHGRKCIVWISVMLLLFVIQIPMYCFLDPAPWGLTILPVYILFMLMGLKLREWNAVDRLTRAPLLPSLAIMVLLFAVHFGLFKLTGDESYYASIFGTRGAWDVFAVVLQLLFAAPALFYLARALGMLQFPRRVLVWMGQHTLGFLTMHCLFAMIYCDIFHNYSKPGTNWYLELQGIPLTSEIILKSILCCTLALLSCGLVLFLKDKLKSRFIVSN